MNKARNPASADHQTGHKIQSYHKRSLIWIGIAVLVLLLNRVLPQSFFEHAYYNGFFRVIRAGYDTLLGWMPIPMIYLVTIFILVRIFVWFRNWASGFWLQLTKALGGVAIVIILFYLLWGFNYRQIALENRLGFNLEKVSGEEIEAEYRRATLALKEISDSLSPALKSDVAIQSLKVKDDDLRQVIEEALSILGIPNTGKVRVRQLWPKGFLLRWSTAGIYIPHALEGHIDPGLLSVQKPFTMAHEMAHGYGVTDEGACNFIAWLACSLSDDSYVRYSGAFSYWRYAASAMPDDMVNASMKTFDPVVLRSLQLIRQNDKLYPDILPQIRDAIYSTYLKRHGVKGGLKSYDYVVLMVSEYQQSLNRVEPASLE